MEGEPSVGGAVTGTIWGMAGVLLFTSVSTLVGPPLTHLLPLKVCSQCSFGPHSPLHGSGSQSPLAGLQVVPAVQIAMQAPVARSTAAVPIATALTVAAPAMVFEPPVLQAASRAKASSARGRDIPDLPRSLSNASTVASHVAALHDLDPAVSRLVERPRHVPGAQLDAPAAVLHEERAEA